MDERTDKRITKTCAQCERQFKVYRPQQKFCAEICKNSHFNALKKIAWEKFKAEAV